MQKLLKNGIIVLVIINLLPGCTGLELHPTYRWKWNLLPARKVLAPMWKRPLLLNRERGFEPCEGGGVAADPSSGRIYTGTSAGRFYALRSSDGALIWKFKTEDGINSTPLLSKKGSEQKIYFGNEAGLLYSLNAINGEKIFSYSAGGEIRSIPAISGRTLIVKDARGKIHAINALNGKGLWIYEMGKPEGYLIASFSGLAIYENTILAGFSNGIAVGVNIIDGTEKWRTDLSEFSPASTEGIESGAEKLDINTTPVITGEQVIFSSFKGGVFSLNPLSGSINWRRGDLKFASGISAREDELYISITHRGIVKISASMEGQTIWESRFPCKTLSKPVIYKDLVIVSDSKFGLIVLSRKTGQVFDRFTPMWGISSYPEVISGRIIFHSNGGSIYTFQILGERLK